MDFCRTWWNIIDLGSTAVQTSQKSIEGSNAGRSAIRRKGNGFVNDDKQTLYLFNWFDLLNWLCNLQNNWTFHVSKERTIRTQMNTDEHGLKRKLVSPAARKNT